MDSASKLKKKSPEAHDPANVVDKIGKLNSSEKKKYEKALKKLMDQLQELTHNMIAVRRRINQVLTPFHDKICNCESSCHCSAPAQCAEKTECTLKTLESSLPTPACMQKLRSSLLEVSSSATHEAVLTSINLNQSAALPLSPQRLNKVLSKEQSKKGLEPSTMLNKTTIIEEQDEDEDEDQDQILPLDRTVPPQSTENKSRLRSAYSLDVRTAPKSTKLGDETSRRLQSGRASIQESTGEESKHVIAPSENDDENSDEDDQRLESGEKSKERSTKQQILPRMIIPQRSTKSDTMELLDNSIHERESVSPRTQSKQSKSITDDNISKQTKLRKSSQCDEIRPLGLAKATSTPGGKLYEKSTTQKVEMKEDRKYPESSVRSSKPTTVRVSSIADEDSIEYSLSEDTDTFISSNKSEQQSPEIRSSVKTRLLSGKATVAESDEEQESEFSPQSSRITAPQGSRQEGRLLSSKAFIRENEDDQEVEYSSLPSKKSEPRSSEGTTRIKSRTLPAKSEVKETEIEETPEDSTVPSRVIDDEYKSSKSSSTSKSTARSKSIPRTIKEVEEVSEYSKSRSKARALPAKYEIRETEIEETPEDNAVPSRVIDDEYRSYKSSSMSKSNARSKSIPRTIKEVEEASQYSKSRSKARALSGKSEIRETEIEETPEDSAVSYRVIEDEYKSKSSSATKSTARSKSIPRTIKEVEEVPEYSKSINKARALSAKSEKRETEIEETSENSVVPSRVIDDEYKSSDQPKSISKLRTPKIRTPTSIIRSEIEVDGKKYVSTACQTSYYLLRCDSIIKKLMSHDPGAVKPADSQKSQRERKLRPAETKLEQEVGFLTVSARTSRSKAGGRSAPRNINSKERSQSDRTTVLMDELEEETDLNESLTQSSHRSPSQDTKPNKSYMKLDKSTATGGGLIRESDLEVDLVDTVDYEGPEYSIPNSTTSYLRDHKRSPDERKPDSTRGGVSFREKSGHSSVVDSDTDDTNEGGSPKQTVTFSEQTKPSNKSARGLRPHRSGGEETDSADNSGSQMATIFEDQTTEVDNISLSKKSSKSPKMQSFADGGQLNKLDMKDSKDLENRSKSGKSKESRRRKFSPTKGDDDEQGGTRILQSSVSNGPENNKNSKRKETYKVPLESSNMYRSEGGNAEKRAISKSISKQTMTSGGTLVEFNEMGYEESDGMATTASYISKQTLPTSKTISNFIVENEVDDGYVVHSYVTEYPTHEAEVREGPTKVKSLKAFSGRTSKSNKILDTNTVPDTNTVQTTVSGEKSKPSLVRPELLVHEKESASYQSLRTGNFPSCDEDATNEEINLPKLTPFLDPNEENDPVQLTTGIATNEENDLPQLTTDLAYSSASAIRDGDTDLDTRTTGIHIPDNELNSLTSPKTSNQFSGLNKSSGTSSKPAVGSGELDANERTPYKPSVTPVFVENALPAMMDPLDIGEMISIKTIASGYFPRCNEAEPNRITQQEDQVHPGAAKRGLVNRGATNITDSTNIENPNKIVAANDNQAPVDVNFVATKKSEVTENILAEVLGQYDTAASPVKNLSRISGNENLSESKQEVVAPVRSYGGDWVKEYSTYSIPTDGICETTDSEMTSDPDSQRDKLDEDSICTYISNKTFESGHFPNCSSVESIKTDSNREEPANHEQNHTWPNASQETIRTSYFPGTCKDTEFSDGTGVQNNFENTGNPDRMPSGKERGNQTTPSMYTFHPAPERSVKSSETQTTIKLSAQEKLSMATKKLGGTAANTLHKYTQVTLDWLPLPIAISRIRTSSGTNANDGNLNSTIISPKNTVMSLASSSLQQFTMPLGPIAPNQSQSQLAETLLNLTQYSSKGNSQQGSPLARQLKRSTIPATGEQFDLLRKIRTIAGEDSPKNLKSEPPSHDDQYKSNSLFYNETQELLKEETKEITPDKEVAIPTEEEKEKQETEENQKKDEVQSDETKLSKCWEQCKEIAAYFTEIKETLKNKRSCHCKQPMLVRTSSTQPRLNKQPDNPQAEGFPGDIGDVHSLETFNGNALEAMRQKSSLKEFFVRIAPDQKNANVFRVNVTERISGDIVGYFVIDECMLESQSFDKLFENYLSLFVVNVDSGKNLVSGQCILVAFFTLLFHFRRKTLINWIKQQKY